MPRIQAVTSETADQSQQQVLDTVKAKFGGVPNLLGTLAQSPAAANAYLSLSEALSKTALSAKEREQLALAVAGSNSCAYCAAAHTAIGAGLGLDKDEAQRNILGQASDARVQALVTIAQQIVAQRGFISNDSLDAARRAGISDAEVVEIVAVIALNILTNYVNHVAETDIDFPKVDVPELTTA